MTRLTNLHLNFFIYKLLLELNQKFRSLAAASAAICRSQRRRYNKIAQIKYHISYIYIFVIRVTKETYTL